MNKTYKYTLTAHEKKEISFDTGVSRLAIANGDGVDGPTTVIMSEITKQNSGDHVSFVDGADAPFADFLVNIVATQSGSGDPSPTNVRPISGFNAVDITRTGKNLFDYNAISRISVGTSERNGMVFNKAGTYSVSCQNSGNYCYCRVFNADGTTKATYYIVSLTTITPATFSISNGEYFALYDAYDFDNITTSKQYFANWQAQVELSDAPTTYEPYNVNTYNINWEDEAGTVYGGNIKPLTGELTVTHVNIASYDGETINEPWISSMDVYVAGATPTTGAQVVYPLTTPVTYQLTPTEIRSLLGQNNIWADCGPVDVRYFVQSTQPMIDYIDDKTENVVEVIKATGHLGGTYTLDDMTCDELCTYARDHSNIVIKATRGSSPIAYDIFILSDYIGTSAVFRNAIITTAIGGGKVLEVRELQADKGNSTNALTVRYININADSDS